MIRWQIRYLKPRLTRWRTVVNFKDARSAKYIKDCLQDQARAQDEMFNREIVNWTGKERLIDSRGRVIAECLFPNLK